MDDDVPLNSSEDAQGEHGADHEGVPGAHDGEGDDGHSGKSHPFRDANEPPYHDETLLRAVELIIDRLRALLLLHRDEPQAIVDALEDMARAVNAAVAHNSKLRPKVVRLGLQLEPRYWVASGHLKEGFAFFGHLFSRARDIGDPQLWSEVLMQWGRYQFLVLSRETGQMVFEWALEKLAETQQDSPDLRLLLQEEIFNARALALSSEAAETQAAALLQEATRLKMPYIKGRVYYSLARHYQRKGDRKRAFECAQQSLCYFYPDRTLEMATQALGSMYINVAAEQEEADSPERPYAERLLVAWEQFVARNLVPWHRAAVLHAQARQLYLRGHYDRACQLVLRAWRAYCRLSDRVGKAQMRHMLGLICTKKAEWERAAHYLRTAQQRYEALGETEHALHAQHAAAYMLMERAEQEPARELARMYLLRAQERLLATRNAIEERVRDPDVRTRMARLVDEDIAAVKRRLACGGHNGKRGAAA